jgi:hypothetical protein
MERFAVVSAFGRGVAAELRGLAASFGPCYIQKQ